MGPGCAFPTAAASTLSAGRPTQERHSSQISTMCGVVDLRYIISLNWFGSLVRLVLSIGSSLV